MEKIDLIKKYYQSWINEDIESLKSCLNRPKFGIRNFFKDLLFSFKDIEFEFISPSNQELNLRSLSFILLVNRRFVTIISRKYFSCVALVIKP